jgi:23S rRNA (pseudouridine1915-N3)-methyltransferase
LIGSAYGISAEIKKQANLLLSLSPLTFTHDHARVILTEQLYRCLMVIAGHPFHHV